MTSPMKPLGRIRNDIKRLPGCICGVYFLFQSGEVTYVGSSENVMPQIYRHMKDRNVDSFAVHECAPFELEELAGDYIAEHGPRENTRFPLGARYKSRPQLKKHCVDGHEVNAVIKHGGLAETILNGRQYYVERDFLNAQALWRSSVANRT
ncbi:hypothetical protein ACFLSF_04640 [Candidatus Bipolaricaulota bacterium]